MGPYVEDPFPPALEQLAEAGPSSDELKRLVKIPGGGGAKLNGGKSRERAVAPKGDKR